MKTNNFTKLALLGVAITASSFSFAQPKCDTTQVVSNLVSNLRVAPDNASITEKKQSYQTLLIGMLAYEKAAASQPLCDDRNQLDKISDKQFTKTLSSKVANVQPSQKNQTCATTKIVSDVLSKLKVGQDDSATLLGMLAYEQAVSDEPRCDDRNQLDKMSDTQVQKDLVKRLAS